MVIVEMMAHLFPNEDGEIVDGRTLHLVKSKLYINIKFCNKKKGTSLLHTGDR